MSRTIIGPWSIVVLVVSLLTMLKFMGDATQNSARFGELYSILFLLNILGLATLAGLVIWNFSRLLSQVRQRQAGAKLTVRMVTMFVVLAVTPVIVVYTFSLQFLHRGIDSWFDVQIENALDDALELSQTSLGIRMSAILKQTELLAANLGDLGDLGASAALDDARLVTGASDLTLMGYRGSIIATSSETTSIVPVSPDDTIVLQVRQSQSYIGLDPIGDAGLHIRVVVPVSMSMGKETRILQALFPISDRLNTLATSVETAFGDYRKLLYLRKPLKISFTLTLSLVLLLSLFTSIWAAIYSASRMVAPLGELVQGTKAVAEGNFRTQIPQSGDDELGFVVDSFNNMTRQLQSAHNETRSSQLQLETQRTYLEAVLSRLSSGVITLSSDRQLVTSNEAAEQILEVNLQTEVNQPLSLIAKTNPRIKPLTDCLSEKLNSQLSDWQQQVELVDSSNRQVLMCRGAALLANEKSDHVIVFDDVTALIQAQRDAAWSEVARRLAHEIKNPLTPIQLSAERLRHKYMGAMPENEAPLFDRLTRNIVQQVESMKQMVNAFSDYAKSPQPQAQSVDLNSLVSDVAELYRPNHLVVVKLEQELDLVVADPNGLRQVLHNLIKNAIEASETTKSGIEINTDINTNLSPPTAVLRISDTGVGIPENVAAQLFEPYVTTKTKGTGLGLAIVKRIIEEHGGTVRIENNRDLGATATIQLPFQPPTTAGKNVGQRQIT